LRYPSIQVNPGFTDTPFDDNALVDTSRVSVGHRRTMPADAVARATLRAIDRGKSEIAVGRQAKLFLLVSRIAPRFVDWGLSRWLLKHFPDAPVLRKQRVNTAE
jgi:short-subunit dehydrogenase